MHSCFSPLLGKLDSCGQKWIGLATFKTRCICYPESAICNLWAAQTNGHSFQFSRIKPGKSTLQINYSLDDMESRRCFGSLGESFARFKGPMSILTAFISYGHRGQEIWRETKMCHLNNSRCMTSFKAATLKTWKCGSGCLFDSLCSKGTKTPTLFEATGCWLKWHEVVLYLKAVSFQILIDICHLSFNCHTVRCGVLSVCYLQWDSDGRTWCIL